jgi:mannosyltransferase
VTAVKALRGRVASHPARADEQRRGRQPWRSVRSIVLGGLQLDVWMMAPAVIVTFAIAAWQADRPSLDFDELFAVGLASQPLSLMWHFLWGQECQMTLYYVFLHGWLAALDTLGLGRSEFLLRLPSLVAVGLTGGVLYRMGARWWGRTSGLVAALVFATNPVLLRQAQEARSYAFQVLLLSLAWYAFLAAIEAADDQAVAPRRRWWIAFAVLLTLAIYAHIDTMICALAFPVALVALALAPTAPDADDTVFARWRKRARASARLFLLSALAVGVAVLPLAIDAMIHGGGNGWVLPATPGRLARMVRDNFFAGVTWVILPMMALLLLALLPVVLRSRRSAAPLIRPFAPPTLAIFAWLVVIWVLFYSLPMHLFHWRYLVVTVAPFALLVGIAVARVRPVVARVGLMLLLALMVASLPLAYHAMPRDDYRTAGRWLDARMQPGDGAVCWPKFYCAFTMGYYVRNLNPATMLYAGAWNWDRRLYYRQLAACVTPPLSDGPTLATYLSGQQRVWLVLAPHGQTPPVAQQQERGEMQFMTADGFHSVVGVSLVTAQAIVVLYERNDAPHVVSP